MTDFVPRRDVQGIYHVNKFFYWIDPWGVQWEMEQGRPVDRAAKGIVG